MKRLKIIENKNQPSTIYTDLKILFDKINHKILIHILTLFLLFDVYCVAIKVPKAVRL